MTSRTVPHTTPIEDDLFETKVTAQYYTRHVKLSVFMLYRFFSVNKGLRNVSVLRREM